MRQLEINLSDLEEAFENSFPESFSYYLDRETGRVVMVGQEAQGMLEELYEEVYDAAGNEVQPLAEVIREQELEQEAEELFAADQVETGYSTRYVTIPRVESYEGYDYMEKFIDTVEDPHLRDLLSSAIGGKGAFRRFKDVLADHFHERERWFAFQDEQTRRRIVDWLHEEGIEPILAPRPVPPSVRPQLLAAALAFVRAAREVPGVTRIALIGSLATDEPSPKDADLLVTVTPDANLSPLATLGRKLHASAQSGTGRGGEVFLADPAGSYLGRFCQWRECGPGLHRDCGAQHCGRRPYLHDDLQVVQLASDLVAAPPLELWPRIVIRGELPADMRQTLVEPLERE
jgi:Uncharacterised protein family (UPF0158)